MPHGKPSFAPYSICRRTTSRSVCSEQAPRGRAHDERRHQIFEHRTGPGDQRRAASDRRRGAAEPEPVPGGHVALGDGEEARQPRFRRQKIVAIGIQGGFRNEKSDREQLASRGRTGNRTPSPSPSPGRRPPGRAAGPRSEVGVAAEAQCRARCASIARQGRARPVQEIAIRFHRSRSSAIALAMSTMDRRLASEFRQLGRQPLLRTLSALASLWASRRANHRAGAASPSGFVRPRRR